MREFVLGDVHGAYKALLQCFEQSGFNYHEDRLIFLGDISDGWPETSDCMDELLKIDNLVFIKGNHDIWFKQWLHDGTIDSVWLFNGGQATIDSYEEAIPEDHICLLDKMVSYYTSENRLFVHAGVKIGMDLEEQDDDVFCWDRNLATMVLKNTAPKIAWEKIYLGHTPVHRFGHQKPLERFNVVLMDTGAAWGERLSMLELNSGEIFQSERTQQLYPGHPGRQ